MRVTRGVKVSRPPADTSRVNTIAATSHRIPRPALIGIGVLILAFAVFMVVRAGILGGSSSNVSTPDVVTPVTHGKPLATTKVATPAKVVLLPGLPPQVAHALRYSRVAVVTLYVGQAPADHASVTAARTGARSTGAGFVAVNVGTDKAAGTIASFAGPLSSPSTLVVRRPGKIVTQLSGPVDAAVVAQAAHNAGARR